MPVTEPAGLGTVDAGEAAGALRHDDTLLLTASSVLAGDWRRRLVEASGDGVCATPRVHAWGHWLAMLASEAEDIPVALSELQEQLLWERVIRADLRGSQPRSDASESMARGLARHAAGAYALMCEYALHSDRLAGEGEEAEALARWIAAMRQELAGMGRVLRAEIPGLLLPHLPGLSGPPRRILLDGFEAFTPLQSSLLQALKEAGAGLERVDAAAAQPGIGLTACSEAEAECRHVAGSIAARLEAGPRTRIGVLLSRKVADVGQLHRILDEVLLPEGTGLASGMQAVDTGGTPLAAAPLVRQLTMLLHLAGRQGASFAEFAPLLFSPGLKGYAEEYRARAALDAWLREGNRHYVSFKSLLGMRGMRDMPQLAAVLKALLVWDDAPRPAGEWVRDVHALLQLTGFLAIDEAGRGASDIRQLNAFRECLASLAAADAVSPRMSRGDFLSLLASRCQATLLHAPALLPQVSVLPLVQVPGLRFDAVYVVALDEEALPLPAEPAPLLPPALQRRHGMPGATAGDAFGTSTFLWRQVMQSAPEVRVSFARNREERELNPSPLLAGIPVADDAPPAAGAERFADEEYEDAPPVPMIAGEPVRGGSGIVKNQSACPFRAFATHRLGIAPLGETEPGIEAKDKGSLLHHALEFIWRRLALQQGLLALDTEACEALVADAVAHAWEQVRLGVSGATRDFEQQRMRRVLGEWLEIERQRPDFRVQQCEKPYELSLPETGEVRFAVRLKADRIDRDAEGRSILIDYKTGRRQPVSEWIGERMAEPQLPLYSMAEGLGEHDAVCFARVRSGDMAFEGLSGEDTGIGKIEVYKGRDEEAEDWPTLLTLWRQRINALAAEFVAGRSEVAPRDRRACDYCGLEAVCRIGEIGFADEAADDEAGGEGAV